MYPHGVLVDCLGRPIAVVDASREADHYRRQAIRQRNIAIREHFRGRSEAQRAYHAGLAKGKKQGHAEGLTEGENKAKEKQETYDQGWKKGNAAAQSPEVQCVSPQVQGPSAPALSAVERRAIGPPPSMAPSRQPSRGPAAPGPQYEGQGYSQGNHGGQQMGYGPYGQSQGNPRPFMSERPEQCYRGGSQLNPNYQRGAPPELGPEDSASNVTSRRGPGQMRPPPRAALESNHHRGGYQGGNHGGW